LTGLHETERWATAECLVFHQTLPPRLEIDLFKMRLLFQRQWFYPRPTRLVFAVLAVMGLVLLEEVTAQKS